MLQEICEPELRESFNDFFETANEENCTVAAMNRDQHSSLKIQLVDFCQTIGASVFRGRNRVNGVKGFGLGVVDKLPNFKLFMPTSTTTLDRMSANLELVLRIESNLKLNLVTMDQKNRVEMLDS